MISHKITVFNGGRATRVEIGLHGTTGLLHLNVVRMRTAPGEKANLYNSETDPKNDQLWLEYLLKRLESLGIELPDEMAEVVSEPVYLREIGKAEERPSCSKDWTTVWNCLTDARSGWMGNLGDFNESTGRYITSQGLEEGHWFLDPLDQNALYIVPNDAYGGAEIEGPETDVFNTLEGEYREHGFFRINPIQLASGIGLVFVEKERRGFSELKGYYVIS